MTSFASLSTNFEGDLFFDDSTQHQAIRTIYSTDASVYQEKPIAVAIPKTVEDIKKLINLATEMGQTLIPRAAGTSLAGQVVGSGIVVDISKHFNQILEINVEERWVRVQPGVIRDDLNVFLKPHGLMFGPETSTANRAMIGGMIGNNSCGLHSIIWGSVRDHLLEVKALLSDGSEAKFSPLTPEGGVIIRPSGIRGPSEILDVSPRDSGLSGFVIPTEEPLDLQSKIYQNTLELLEKPENQHEIRTHFPKPSVKRRNTGYALDALLEDCNSQTPPSGGLNFCKLIAGSEGTLCFVTEAKLNLIEVPPAGVALVCVHTKSINEALKANLIALQHNCAASELADDFILELAKTNSEQLQNRSFVVGEPKAILMIELFAETQQEAVQKAEELIKSLQSNNLGYAYPILYGEDTKKAWNLRKAGLGILSNIEGPEKPVNLIEDFGVDVHDLPQFIEDLERVAATFNLRLQHSAHAGAGEVHSIPMMNLKSSEGQRVFRELLKSSATLVKSYGGSLSGEHGDGRLRGEFIPLMVGDKNYALFRQIKHIWDPNGVFNRGKITDTPSMNTFLRYEADVLPPQIKTTFRFDNENGFLGLAEKCSGSGDCRKSHLSGGTMCPSFMATRNEKDTTRARANMLRAFLTSSSPVQPAYASKGRSEEAKNILDLCLSCKACKAECPTSVDVGKMKAEFMQQYYDQHGIPFRSWLISNFTKMMRLANYVPSIYNFIFKTPTLRKLANRLVGFHPERTMPLINSFKKFSSETPRHAVKGKVYLFLDEFTQYNDGEIGGKAILLLEKLGYEVIIPEHIESGRTYLSKGLVKEAKNIAIRNIQLLSAIITPETPLIGIEPSAILTFRDEYLDLVPEELREAAKNIAQNTLLFDEFIAKEIEAKRINQNSFTQNAHLIKLHGHCHQKALASQVPTKKMLSLPKNYEVQLIPSGCCGMAGSFGYEKEHYELSQQIGELVLFPTVRAQPADVIIAAPGTSCRHQIKDGTGRKALHPIEILYDALI